MKKSWNVMCNVDKVIIDVINKAGYLYVPKNNVPDMSSTINCFLSADPECNTIYTFIDGKPDTTYVKYGEWEVFNGRFAE